MTPRTLRLLARLTFGVSLAVMAWTLYAPVVPGPPASFRLDLVVHAAVFALSTATGLAAGVRPSVLIGLLAANAVASEAIQHWLLPNRSGDVLDLIADLTGIAVGAAAWVVARRAWRASRGARDVRTDAPPGHGGAR